MNIDTIAARLTTEKITYYVDEISPTPTGMAIEPRDGDYCPAIAVKDDGSVYIEAYTEDGDVMPDIRPHGGRAINNEDDVIAALEYFAEITGTQLR